MCVSTPHVGACFACRSSCCAMPNIIQVTFIYTVFRLALYLIFICMITCNVITTIYLLQVLSSLKSLVAQQKQSLHFLFVICLLDQRDYICEYCARAFKSSHNLVVHRMIHTGEKPIQWVGAWFNGALLSGLCQLSQEWMCILWVQFHLLRNNAVKISFTVHFNISFGLDHSLHESIQIFTSLYSSASCSL